jgi:hypothetical protein
MPEAFKGTLGQLSLPDILGLLGNGKKTGCLTLRNGSDVGEIYLQEGEIVHVVAGFEEGQAAFSSLAVWLDGNFSFEPDVESPEQTMTTPMDQILISARREAAEWQDIRRFIPDDTVVLSFSPTGESEEVSLRSQEWRVLAQIDGSRSALEITEALRLERKDVLKILSRLIEDGLVRVTEGKPKPMETTVDAVFFERLSEEFTNLMGPIGPVIIDEEIREIGKSRDAFPRDRVAELVERISAAIEDESKKLGFQRIMLDALREL